MILHGLRQWHGHRDELRHGGRCVSRHYYDVHQLMQAKEFPAWQAPRDLARDCARHARLFFGSADLGLTTAEPGSLTLVTSPGMQEALARDYEAMTGMVFENVPPLSRVLDSVAELERAINGNPI